MAQGNWQKDGDWYRLQNADGDSLAVRCQKWHSDDWQHIGDFFAVGGGEQNDLQAPEQPETRSAGD